jgi:hypothetical protein
MEETQTLTPRDNAASVEGWGGTRQRGSRPRVFLHERMGMNDKEKLEAIREWSKTAEISIGSYRELMKILDAGRGEK